MKAKLILGIVVVGALLVVLSFLWGLFFSAERTWTPEKSEMVSQLSTEVQKLHMKVKLGERNPAAYGDSDPEELKSQYELTKEKLVTLRTEFESATQSPKSISTALRWVGMICLLGGLFSMRMLDG